MPIVNITIRQHTYQIACDPGQEVHLEHIATLFSKRINVLAGSMSKASDQLLLVMTALMLEDELTELKRMRANVSEEQAENVQAKCDDAVAEAIEAIAEYVESVAQKLETS